MSSKFQGSQDLLNSPQFDSESVSVQGELCLNARHKDTGCHRCADACPTGAILLSNQDNHSPHGPLLPQLDAQRCIRCGLCLHHCPTDVFTQPNPPEIKLSQTLANLPDAPLGLACPQHPNPTLTPAPITTVAPHKRCLAALSISQLIDLSHTGQRPIWLDDSPCPECPLGHVQPVMAQTAAATNRLLQAFGRSPVIYTHLSQQEALNPEPSQVALIVGDQPKLSRRGLFEALGQLTRQATAGANLDDSSTLPTQGSLPVSQRLPQRVPASRRHLRQQLARLGEPIEGPVETEGLPLANLNIDAGACSACRLCARFCPTGALHFVADAEKFGLSFNPSLCLDCGICAVACPEGAISFGSEVAPAMLVADKAAWLAVGRLAACTSCGELTAIQDEVSENQPRCYSCRQGGRPAAPLKDPAGLMADLLKYRS